MRWIRLHNKQQYGQDVNTRKVYRIEECSIQEVRQAAFLDKLSRLVRPARPED